MKIGHEDPEVYRQRLEAKLTPERIRATLGFAGLYQMAHELIKSSVVDDVREFYWRAVADGVVVYDEHAYSEQVLTRAPKNRFRACLLWLVEADAITMSQADRLKQIYAHRHDLSHELIKYVVDPDFEPDVTLLAEALTILTGHPTVLDRHRAGHRHLRGLRRHRPRRRGAAVAVRASAVH